MSQTDDRRNKTLPVTGEVGSEGGSFADPTTQVATFSGPAAPNIAPAEAAAGRMPLSTETVSRAALEGREVEQETESGMLRYPTEPPSPADAREGRRVGGSRWRAGLVGVAVGTAALIGVSKLRRK